MTLDGIESLDAAIISVSAGATFVNGKLVEQAGEEAQPEAA